ncbi:hypothetical protein AGOR_G00221860 [Albula goreensis]|uniref:heme oxygenase (biliverdin-producing) n=1 Tax=Albula goreensis TaxID=1534307 RepID=A0A8T3CN72_9TELE|nr:hypothetical protein AGOR_G00221860 [Albula goreensis]
MILWRGEKKSERLISLYCNITEMEGNMKKLTEKVQSSDSDLSEQIKAVTKDSHVRAENTELMLSYQRGLITLQQYKLLMCSLYEIYRALEEELDRNSSHPGVAPIYFPQELARLEALQRDLEFLFGQDWQKKLVVPAATHRYAQRLRQIGKENPLFLVPHAYTRYLGDLSGGQVLGRITQKSLGLSSEKGVSFFAFPGVTSPNRFKQLYRSRMNSVELTKEEREGVLEEAVRAFELNIEVFDDLQKMLGVAETDSDTRHRQSARDSRDAAHGVETVKSRLENAQLSSSDLSEQIKAVTKDSHVRAENTELMLSYQRGLITLQQYKLLMCSLYEIYRALEEELDQNSSHPGVAPIYFPQELARLEALQRDLEFLFGQDWQKKLVVPAATHRYAQRLRQIGKENPLFLVPHAYTRYLSPNRFKQLYRSRMNSVELTEEEREGVLEEAVRAFELNIEVFDDLQRILTFTENSVGPKPVTPKSATHGHQSVAGTTQLPTSIIPNSTVLRLVLAVCVALAVAMGMYAR